MAAMASTARPEASVWQWLPDRATIYRDLTFKSTAQEDEVYGALTHFKGMQMSWKPATSSADWFDATRWTNWTANHWEVPLACVLVYFVLIPTLKRMVAKYGKWNVRNAAFYWNASLSIFSWCGVFACVPVLSSSFLEHGLYYTTCAPAAWYGAGLTGFFVMLFVYSKIAELMDTILLLLAGKPVIALQWWHHSTVLLYCWHSYSTRIATGLWFAAMNYSVHSVMYGYFALKATPYRKSVTPYAIFITLAQLLQMLVGMFVTIKAVMYQNEGQECHVNRTNSLLGLTMYFSYFVLFFKLFIDNYVTKARKASKADGLPPKRKTVGELTRSVTRELTNKIMPQMDMEAEDDAAESTEVLDETHKKVN
mmetsp:Transcript_98753/g.260650  ORF Transcript_98753/g.260650 Transcript_98753/m.260650 type:complete len:366 (-) Transcript_98753:188-1285(-)